MRLGSRRYICTSRKTKRIAMLFVVFGVFILAVLFSFLYCVYSLRPSVTAMAKSRAKEIALAAINRAVAEKLAQENIAYSDFVEFTYSADGSIASVQNNLSGISAIKSDLAIEVGEAISEISKDTLSIPLGTLSGIDILYGTGPDISLEIKPYGYAEADLKTKFRDAGINQTVFEVTAEVSAEIGVLMPTIRAGEQVKTSVPVISTVIVGDIPDSYTNVDRQGYEYEEDVLELAE